MTRPTWVIDTSSLVEIKSSVPHAERERVFDALTALVSAGRLLFPREVLNELKRGVGEGPPDRPCGWAQDVEALACNTAPTSDQVRFVLDVVPDVLDPAKESGEDEADPYILALATKLRGEGVDARVVTEETRNYPDKLSLNTACGMLGVPSVPLRGLLRAEGIIPA